MQALAHGIAGSSSLTSLDAELKGLGSAGVVALAQALHSSCQLKSLVLGRNPLGDAG
jgi:hypothetical protein